MKLVIISPEFPEVVDNGMGIAAPVFDSATGLAARGHQVHVLVPARLHRVTVKDKVSVHEFAIGEILRTTGNPYSTPAGLIREDQLRVRALAYQCWFEYVEIVRGGLEPDIVECIDYQGAAYFYALHRLLGYPEATAPLVTSSIFPSFLFMHYDHQPSHLWQLYAAAQQEKFQMAASDGLLVPNETLGNAIQARLHVPRPYVCYPSCEIALPEAILPPRKSDQILFLADPRYHNGTAVFLKACRNLWDDGLKFTVKVIDPGNAPTTHGDWISAGSSDAYREYMEQGYLKLCSRRMSREKIRELLAESRALATPAFLDDLPYACIEAMALGRPIVRTSPDGPADFAGGLGSELGRDTRHVIEEKIERIVAASRSELEDLGAQANNWTVRMCSPEKALSEKENLFGQIILSAGRTRRKIFPNPAYLDKQKCPSLPLPCPGPLNNDFESNLLSVIVPVFNLSSYLEEALDSIYESTYRPVEIIVIDDGSTDRDTLEMMSSLQSLYPEDAGTKLRVLMKERNDGIVGVRNIGATMSRGEFLCFLDSDDVVRPSYFETAIAVLKKFSNVGFVGSWVEEFGAKSGHWFPSNYELPLALISNQNIAASVVRRIAFQGNAVPYGLADYEGWISIVAGGWAGINIPEMLFRYRVRSDSATTLKTVSSNKVATEIIVRRHAELFQRFGDDLHLLFFHNAFYEVQELHREMESMREANEAVNQVCPRVPASLVEQFRHCMDRPKEAWTLPLNVAKIFIPEPLRAAVKRYLAVPEDKSLFDHLFRR